MTPTPRHTARLVRIGAVIGLVGLGVTPLVCADADRSVDAVDPSVPKSWFAGSGNQMPEAFGPIVEGSAFESVAWSPDGRLVAAGTGSGLIIIVDHHRQRLVARLDHGQGRVRSLSFSPTGLLAAGADIERAAVWRLPNPQPIWEGRGSVVAFAPVGETLLHADRYEPETAGGSTFLTDFTDARQPTHTILPTASAAGVQQARWEPETGRQAFLFGDQSVVVRRPGGGLSRLDGDKPRFVDIVWAGGHLIAMTQEGALHRAEFGEGWSRWPAIVDVGRGSMVWLDAISLLAVGTDDEGIRLVDLELGKVFRGFPADDHGARRLAHHRESGSVAVAARDLRVWSPSDGSSTDPPIALATPFEPELLGLSTAYLAAVPLRGDLEVWRLDRPVTAPRRIPLDCPEPSDASSEPKPRTDRARILAVGISSAGTAVVVVRDGRVSQVFDLGAADKIPCGGRPLSSDHLDGYPEHVAISDDARVVYQSHGVTAGRFGPTAADTDVVGDLTLQCAGTRRQHDLRMKALALSGDGDTLAIAYDGRPCGDPTTVVVWDGARGKPSKRHRVSIDANVLALVFSADHQVLIQVDDGSIHRLDGEGKLHSDGRFRTDRGSPRVWGGGSVLIEDRRLSVHDLAGDRRSLHTSDATGWVVCLVDGCRGETTEALFTRHRRGALAPEHPWLPPLQTAHAPTATPPEPPALDCHDTGDDHVLVAGGADTATWLTGGRHANGSTTVVTLVGAKSLPSDLQTDPDGSSPVVVRETRPPYRRWTLECSRPPAVGTSP